MAESDVDVWTMTKADFDMLMNRFPSLAISMSRLSEPAPVAGTAAPPPPAGRPAVCQRHMRAWRRPRQSARRRQQAAAAGEMKPPRAARVLASGTANLSGFGKLTFALLILLLILLLCCHHSVHGLWPSQRPGRGAARRRRRSTGRSAPSTLPGSYEVAAADRAWPAAAPGRRAGAATPTYTPFPTDTPLPTVTPLPTIRHAYPSSTRAGVRCRRRG